jgi:hypothetical protein
MNDVLLLSPKNMPVVSWSMAARRPTVVGIVEREVVVCRRRPPLSAGGRRLRGARS